MARKSGEIIEAEQSRVEDVGKEYSMPRGKCTAKGRIWGRIIWRKRGANNVEMRGNQQRI